MLLTYERQMLARANASTYLIAARAPGARRLSIESLLSRATRQGEAPSSVTVRAAQDAPVEMSFGRGNTVFVNPYTGEVLGRGAEGLRGFFGTVTDWHRWIGREGEGRAVGKAITGACNLAFLFLVVSGLYLWWPRNKSKAAWRNALWFRRGLSPKARDFNWHNVIGFWALVPLFFIVLSGVVISYPWASNLVFRAVGETPPARRGPPGGGPPGGGSPRSEGGGREAGGPERGAGAGREGGERGGRRGGRPVEKLDAAVVSGLDGLWARAEQQAQKQAPNWRSITLQLPREKEAPLEFSIDSGSGGQPQHRAQLTLARSGEVEKFETFSDQSLGRRLRAFLRFAHTGEVGGLPGQTLAGLASLGGVLLVWTGLALAWRRLLAARARKARGSTMQPQADAT